MSVIQSFGGQGKQTVFKNPSTLKICLHRQMLKVSKDRRSKNRGIDEQNRRTHPICAGRGSPEMELSPNRVVIPNVGRCRGFVGWPMLEPCRGPSGGMAGRFPWVLPRPTASVHAGTTSPKSAIRSGISGVFGAIFFASEAKASSAGDRAALRDTPSNTGPRDRDTPDTHRGKVARRAGGGGGLPPAGRHATAPSMPAGPRFASPRSAP